jgi:hypothetical protein
MQLRAFIFLLFFIFCSALVAQNITGMWEGSFGLADVKTVQEIKVRVEVTVSEGEYTGIIYTRGLDKNTVWGCDYVVAGHLRLHDGVVSLVRKSLIRNPGIAESKCEFFDKLELVLPYRGEAKKIKAYWYWQDGRFESFSITKKSAVVSEIAKEELDTYNIAMYESFEKNNVFLLPKKRLHKIAAELEVDSSDIMLEFSSVDQDLHDSIEISINGVVLRRNHDVSKKTLRLQMKPVADSVNKIIVISNSVVQPKLMIKLHVKQQQQVWEYTLEPGFTRNAVLLLKPKQN